MRKKILALIMISIVTLLALAGCGSTGNQGADNSKGQSKEIFIPAAVSLQAALTELEKSYVGKHPDVKLTFTFGASGTLQKQIEQGAPADLFISAGKSQMDALGKKNLLETGTRVDLLSNELVLITGKDNNNIGSMQDLTKPQVKRIAIGSPDSVPAGKYAQDSLKALTLWDTLQPKFVFANDVAQVLNYVETGNAEAGLVYRSDAKLSDKVKVAYAVPDTAHTLIVYPAAVLTNSKNKDIAGNFLKYLESSEAQQVFARYGFKTSGK
ncbi:MAG: molybdate ABC transporter substrate-binding protein [Desulfitobacteriaceae bacterium]